MLKTRASPHIRPPSSLPLASTRHLHQSPPPLPRFPPISISLPVASFRSSQQRRPCRHLQSTERTMTWTKCSAVCLITSELNKINLVPYINTVLPDSSNCSPITFHPIIALFHSSLPVAVLHVQIYKLIPMNFREKY